MFNFNLRCNTIFKHHAALYCSMGLAGYVSVCMLLYCVSFDYVSLHVSAYGHLQVCRIFLFSYA
jgi:hypothetical protein